MNGETLSDLYHYREDAWIFDNLNPDQQKMLIRYPERQPSTLSLKMQGADQCPDRPVIEEAEQVRKEDEFLKAHGVV